MEDLSKMRLCAGAACPTNMNMTDEAGQVRVVIPHTGPGGPTDEDKNLAIEVLQRFNNYEHLMHFIGCYKNIIEQAGIKIACRVCGCTEAKACPGGCHWIEPDLCSACEDNGGSSGD